MADETVPERVARRVAEREARLKERAEARAAALAESGTTAALHKAQIMAATPTELLAAIVAKGALQDAPVSVTFAADAGFKVLTIAIGADHTATLYVDAESLEALGSYDVSN